MSTAVTADALLHDNSCSFKEKNLESCVAQPLTSGVLLHDNLLPLSEEEGFSCTLNFMSRNTCAIKLAASVRGNGMVGHGVELK